MKTISALLALSASLLQAQAARPITQQNPQATTWTFALSGDSRNCGDVVMPSIAQGAKGASAEFYWELGDFRALYDFDQDMQGELRDGKPRKLTINDYLGRAWDDFIRNQMNPFEMPVFLGIGNHELYGGKTRADYIAQFGDWINNEMIRKQRLADDPQDHRLKTYYHWRWRTVDLISLDNASRDQFDPVQMRWFEGTLAKIAASKETQSLVVGMHAALPDSLAAGHSMSDYPEGEKSGRRVYTDLLEFQKKTGKHVYIFASHSHFYMANVFNSDYWKTHGGVLPGWIVGTAGAERYALPETAKMADVAQTDVYGFMVGKVGTDGSIEFKFQEVQERDVPATVTARYRDGLVHECFTGNSQNRNTGM
jgi:hypothetical protein